ncbi:uncharacterized protein LOC119376595 [Rhipicephalus sanguineus]|uniref:uncharacterized protein LOC119376595 n=1 Tax=Rhipicephalus sanguineus TaxID=34632 RepID=UPI0020C2D772|nr:uncharacterized protein LOC119376595 [Rhipicephalus sanguineus]
MVSSWSTYRIRLEAYFEGNEITDSAKCRAVLVSSLSDNVVRLLQGRLSTVPVNSRTYEQIVEYLEKQYNPQVNETAASFSFFMRKQQGGEGIREYISDLLRLAKNCNFGDSLNRVLRDRIVCGIRNDDARRCLLTHKKLTVEEAEEFAIASEKALNDVLSPVSVSEWATPVVPVAKKNGDIRLCGDFKLTVNPASHLEQYPLPKVEDIFAALSGGEVFTTLDLRNAYNQLPLDAEARKTTVLNTHRGLYCYNRLAFGIASAPALFQRRMESILLGMPNVQVYLDNIIVAEKRNDTSVLRQVFQRLRENNLKLNKAKCRFREAQVAFLGHRIDADGLHPLQDNLEAVHAAPKPASQLVDSTNNDALLRQVKTWILRGWPKQLGQEQQGFLPYFTRRTTPTQGGQSPAEMMLGFQPRTRLSAQFTEEVDREPMVNTFTAPMQRFPQGAPVWSRQYNQAGQRWLPGTVTSSRGRRLVMVDTTGGMQCRHVEQLRPRHLRTVAKQECSATRPSEQQPSPRDPPSHDQPSAGDNIESTDLSLTPTASELPRRSTRIRRQPDRLGFV